MLEMLQFCVLTFMYTNIDTQKKQESMDKQTRNDNVIHQKAANWKNKKLYDIRGLACFSLDSFIDTHTHTLWIFYPYTKVCDRTNRSVE